MEHEDLLVSYPHNVWEQREEFLLLPGDGLILVSGNGRILFFDNRARLLLGTAASQARGEQVEAIWPELAGYWSTTPSALISRARGIHRSMCGANRRPYASSAPTMGWAWCCWVIAPLSKGSPASSC